MMHLAWPSTGGGDASAHQALHARESAMPPAAGLPSLRLIDATRSSRRGRVRRLRQMLVDISRRQAGGAAKGGRYNKHDTARLRFIRDKRSQGWYTTGNTRACGRLQSIC